MADINLIPDPSRAGAPANGNAAEEPVWDIIELIFFAYRDFVGDPDGVLAAFDSAARITACCILSIAILD